MKFAPRVAVSVALVSMLWSPINWNFADAAESVASPVPAVTSVDSRLGQLESRIKLAQTEGRLTIEEADNYKSAIAQIAEGKAAYLSISGTLGPAMRARLQHAVDRLEKRFDTTLHDRKVASANLAGAEALIGNLISQARQDNRLSEAESTQLHDQLAAVQDLKTNLSRDGVFNYGDALVISMHLDRVVEHLGKLLDEPVLDAPTADAIGAQISNALASGKVAADRVAVLRKEYDDLVLQLTRVKDIANPVMKSQQSLFLTAEMELLKNKVELAAASKVVSIAPQERQVQVDHMLAAALIAGELSPAEAHELTAELQGTSTNMGAVTPVPDDKALRASLELERIAGHINRWSHPMSRDWPGLDAFQADFSKSVDAALAGNRITSEQAAAFKDAAAKLAQAEAEYKASQGALDGREALELAMQIEQLRVKLHREAKDRDAAIPDVAALQKELDKAIADGVEAGKVRGVSRWTERLHQIEELRSNFEKSPGGLDDRAKLELAVILAEAIADVQAQLHRDLPYEMSLDLRLDQLGDRVSNAVATGILPVERGTQYRAGVDTILQQLWSGRRSDNGLSAAESLVVANDVTLIAGQLEQELRDLAMPAREVTQKLADLQVRIGRAVANGRLTVAQANSLVADVERQSAAINNAATNGGGVSHGEGLKFAYDAHRLATQYETMLHSDPVPVTDVAHRAMIIDNRLANSLASGQLSVPQAQQFKTALERVLSSSAAYRDTDTGLSYPEALALSIELDSVGAWMDRGIRQDTANRDVDTREVEIQRRIKDLIAGGKLTVKDAEALRGELDRIEESEAAFRVSEEGLNYAEALTLTLDLDRLSARVDSLLKSASNIQPRKQQ